MFSNFCFLNKKIFKLSLSRVFSDCKITFLSSSFIFKNIMNIFRVRFFVMKCLNWFELIEKQNSFLCLSYLILIIILLKSTFPYCILNHSFKPQGRNSPQALPRRSENEWKQSLVTMYSMFKTNMPNQCSKTIISAVNNQPFFRQSEEEEKLAH